MTIIKLNLKGSKYASTPYASHLDLSFKIQFEDAQSTERAICVPPNTQLLEIQHKSSKGALCAL